MWIRISQLILTIKNIALIGVGIGLCIALINSLVNFGFIAWANIQGYSTYSLLIEELRLLTRGVVVINKDNKVTYVEYVPEVTQAVNFDAALEAIKADI